MKRSLVLTLLSILWWSCSPYSKQIDLPDPEITANTTHMIHPDAPAETKIFSHLFGLWGATQVNKNRDGTWSSDTSHSEWRWYSILDGHAIQDDWIKFETTEASLQTAQIVGTNIRIYNVTQNKWHMVWMDKTRREPAIFTAINIDNTVIMSGENAQGRQIRNTFYNLSKDDFDWKQEWTFDEGNSWVVVSKMHCKRKS